MELRDAQKSQITSQRDWEGRVQGTFDQRFRAGDRNEFVQKDGMTDVVIGTAVLEARRRGDDEVEGVTLSGNLPGGRVTRAGFILQGGDGTYDPPWSSAPGGEFQIGKRLSGPSIRTEPNGAQQWVDYESHIAAREKLKTAFGEIDTFRVDVNFVYQNGGRSKFTFWYDPDWGYAVKPSVELRNAGGQRDVRVREMEARSRKG